MIEVEFEWDNSKALINSEKHGVSFEAAPYVFDDAFAFEWCDIDSKPSEIRYVISGMVSDVNPDCGLYGAR